MTILIDNLFVDQKRCISLYKAFNFYTLNNVYFIHSIIIYLHIYSYLSIKLNLLYVYISVSFSISNADCVRRFIRDSCSVPRCQLVRDSFAILESYPIATRVFTSTQETPWSRHENLVSGQVDPGVFRGHPQDRAHTSQIVLNPA